MINTKLENYSVLKMLVLEEALGKHSTVEMSRSLGFKFDKYKRWMKNEKILKWDEFNILCDRAGLNLTNALEVIRFPYSQYLSVNSFFAYLKEFNAFKTNQEASDYLKCHVSVVKRYNNGNTFPDVETVFKMIDFKTNILSLFLNRLFSQKINNTLLRKWIEDGSKQARFETQLPLSSIIEAALNLEAYKQKTEATDVWLAQLLGFSREDIRAVLKRMVDSQIITCEKDDVYLVNNYTTNLDGVSSQEIIPFIQILNLKLVENLERRKDANYQPDARPGAVVYRVFPASLESMDKINSLLSKVSVDILKILEEDSHPKIEARAVLLQHFSLTK